MAHSSLLKTSRFLPLFVTQFLGAFNDNLFKNAFVALLAYRIATQPGTDGPLHVVLAGAIFILPFFLFSATAGELADTYDKAMLARFTKIGEIFIMMAATIGLYLGNVWFLQFVLFCLGMQATFFGPIKYALLPQHLHEDELIAGNAYIEAGTFLAILLGTISGELLVLRDSGIFIVSAGMLLCAFAGYQSSRYIPYAAPAAPHMRISRNIAKATWHIVSASRTHKDVFAAILGSSWFWFVGAVLLSQFPTYAKDNLHGDETVFTLLLSMFSIGIGIGSFLCNRMLKGAVHATYVAPAAWALSLFTLDLYFATARAAYEGSALMHAAAFLQFAANWRILFDLLMIAISAGVYIVPLYAIMQERSAPEQRARVIASNNILNALFMVTSAVLVIALFKLSFSVAQIFLIIALMNAVVALLIRRLR